MSACKEFSRCEAYSFSSFPAGTQDLSIARSWALASMHPEPYNDECRVALTTGHRCAVQQEELTLKDALHKEFSFSFFPHPCPSGIHTFLHKIPPSFPTSSLKNYFNFK